MPGLRVIIAKYFIWKGSLWQKANGSPEQYEGDTEIRLNHNLRHLPHQLSKRGIEP